MEQWIAGCIESTLILPSVSQVYQNQQLFEGAYESGFLIRIS